ncbi:MAG: hypothetical protein NVSMB49_21210 [Ktedonobacteraceae bacterium]
MALEDYLEPEVAVTAVVVAAVFSPRARQIIRRGAVYGLAGIMVAGDALASAGRSIGRGVQAAAAAAAQSATAATTQSATAAQPTSTVTEPTNTSEAQKKATTRNTTTKTPQEGIGGQS